MSVKVKAKPLRAVTPPERDFEIGRLNLQGPRGTQIMLEEAATSITLERTIEGASTLQIVIRDYYRNVLRSGPIRNIPSNLVMDSVSYTLVKVGHGPNMLTLTFEETAWNVLRRYTSARKANRDNVTRAQFIEQLVREPKERTIPFRCPEKNIRQAVEPIREQGSTARGARRP